MQTDKKSAIDLTEIAIGILVLGIVVSVGAIIINKVGVNQITNAPTYTVSNETITPGTATTLTKMWVKSVDRVVNATTGDLITSANYSVSITTDTGVGTVSNSTCKAPYCIGASSQKVTYTVYNTSDVRYDLPNDAVGGLTEYGNWFKILVIVGVAGIILAILFMAFGGRNRNAGAVSY